METISFNCCFITPAFLGGADPKGTPELRPPSIKGTLRFWWRALNGHLPLIELQNKEVKLFGGFYKESEKVVTMRSKVIIRVDCNDLYTSLNMPEYKVSTYNGKYFINILYYLVYGHTNYTPERKTHMVDSFIPPEVKFQVHLTFHRDLSSDDKEAVIKAFLVLSKFGGLGSKSRNGFGCFEVTESNIKEQATTLPKILIKDLKRNELSAFSSFSNQSSIYETVLPSEDSDDDWLGFDRWQDALGLIGKMYQVARERLDTPHHTYNNRLYIAQPIEVKGKRIDNFLERHGKAFFFNIRRNADGKFVGRVLSMPYKFIEGKPDISTHKADQHLRSYQKSNEKFKSIFLLNPYFKEIG